MREQKLKHSCQGLELVFIAHCKWFEVVVQYCLEEVSADTNLIEKLMKD